MLSTLNVPSTPRPRPPAKMRRAPSLPFHPPPPYAPRMDMILDSPISATNQLVGSPPGDGATLTSPAMEQWINETSREELSDLLVVAEDIIKTRETELGLTSALCKNLYQENIQLKTKHDALLARLPIQSPSPLPSPTRSLSPLPPGSPHYYSISRPHSPILTVPTPPPHQRHARRISVTPSELSLLADQNAELLDKLEKLEEESAQADLAGKRKLRKLEREIQGLREELDKTQEKGAELEAKAVSVFALSDDELLRKKQEEKEERAERARALREKSSAASSGEVSFDEPVRDFAPPPELPLVKNNVPLAKSPALLPLNLSAKAVSPSPATLNLPPTATLPSPGLENTPPFSQPMSRLQSEPITFSSALRDDSRMGSPPPRKVSPAPRLEYAIISQLLAKIRELEETNLQISVEQNATTERLHTMQWDAESIRQAYDALTQGDSEVRVLPEDEADDEAEEDSHDKAGSVAESSTGDRSTKSSAGRKRERAGDTIRFSSLRRTIDGHLSRASISSGVFSAPTSPDKDQVELDFAQGILKEMQSTTRSHIAVLPESRTHGQKTRKSVMGLFDIGVADDGVAGTYPRTLSVSPAFLAQTNPGDVSAWSTDAADGYEPFRSPSLSPSASLFPSRLPSPSPSMQKLPTTGSTRRNGHTLGSEIGADDWPVGEDERGWNYHLRASSLCDLTGIVSAGNESADAKAKQNANASANPGVQPPADNKPTVVASHPPSPVLKSVSAPTSSGWEDVSDDDKSALFGVHLNHSFESVGSSTPTKGPTGTNKGGPQLQLVIEPPTPSPNKFLRSSRSSHSLRNPRGLSTSVSASAADGVTDGRLPEARSARNTRLSQTVRARTHRWVERVEERYKDDAAVGTRKPSGNVRGHGYAQTQGHAQAHGRAHVHSRRVSAVTALDETFDAVMEQFSRSNLALAGITAAREELDADASLLSVDRDGDHDGDGDMSLSAEVMAARPQRAGFVGLLLEVWLWLQFAVVVMVFLWAMARRGPKSVLEDAERRRGAAVMRRAASY